MMRYDRYYVAGLFAIDATEDFHGSFGLLPISTVDIAAITDTNQAGYAHRRLLEKVRVPDRRPVRLLADGERLVVWDGTHRVMAARMRGEPTIQAHIRNIGAKEKSNG